MRIQLLFAARGGARGELSSRLDDVAAAVAGDVAARVTLLTQVDDDVFPLANPLCRPFDAVLELDSETDDDADDLLAATIAVPRSLADVIHVDLSGVLVGTAKRIIDGPVTPVRYLYVMRRKAGTTREQYLSYYFEQHSRFGHRTPAISGYTQFHVDPARSADAAAAMGVGVHGADSVSELHLPSLPDFLAAISSVPSLGMEAAEDEARFVDRDNSVSFCCDTRRTIGSLTDTRR
jgi:hypothetical protein